MTPTNTTPATVPVSFDCPADLASQLSALAHSQGVPLSAFVAGLVITPLEDQLAES